MFTTHDQRLRGDRQAYVCRSLELPLTPFMATGGLREAVRSLSWRCRRSEGNSTQITEPLLDQPGDAGTGRI